MNGSFDSRCGNSQVGDSQAGNSPVGEVEPGDAELGESGFESRADDGVWLARGALSGMDAAARAGVVNRTHRVVRQRARIMQARRSRVRSLMVPLIICSALLILSVVAVWSGLYQYQAAEAAEMVEADVAALAAADANNHFLVVLLWFVPVSLALLAAVWVRRSRDGAESETIR